MVAENTTAENAQVEDKRIKKQNVGIQAKKRSAPERKETANKKPRKSSSAAKHADKPQKVTRRDERRELMSQARAKWELLRPRSTTKEKSITLVQELLDMLRGRIVEFVFRHDGSRIVQWMLGEGNEKQREIVMKELMACADQPTFGTGPFFVRLACDRFGCHLAFKMLRTAGKKQRQVIFDKYLRGSTSELMRSRHGADVLDLAYQTTLNARAKAELSVELLYGKERKLFDTVRGKLFDHKPEEVGKKGPRNAFGHSLELLEESFRDVVVDSAGAVINQLIDRENILRFEIVHAAIREYLDVLVTSYSKERSQELAALLGPAVVHIAHTKPGIHAAVQCVKLLDAKHRKKLLRGLKTHVRKLVEDEFGHRLVIALFEWVDDTKLVGNMVRTEMFSASQLDAELNDAVESQKSKSRGGKSRAEKKGKEKKEKAGTNTDMEAEASVDVAYLRTVCTHRYARMPLLNLLVGRESRYFNPDMYGFVWESIDVEKFGTTSKKDSGVRRKELLSSFEDGIREVMKREMRTLLMNHWSAAVVIGALLSESTSESVASGIVNCLASEDEVRELAGNVCARKTLATIFKIGGAKTACTVLDNCETKILRGLVNAKGCEPIGEQLARGSGRVEAQKLREK